MHYEINVALNGRHFFGTHKRSITDKVALNKIVKVFKEKFPESEGFELSCSKCEQTERTVHLD